MTSDIYKQIQAMLVQKHGVQLTGFRKACRSLVQNEVLDYVENADEHDLIGFDYEEHIDYLFLEYYGNLSVVPAAYRIDKDDDGYDHIHAWVIETSSRITDAKLSQFGRIADGDGPRITVHIIGHHGRETSTLDTDKLMAFAFADAFSNADPEEWQQIRQEAFDAPTSLKEPARNTRPIRTNKPDERAILRAIYDLGLIQEGDEL